MECHASGDPVPSIIYKPYLSRLRWTGINVLRRELIVLKELGKLTL